MYRSWRLCPAWVWRVGDPEEGDFFFQASQPHTYSVTAQSPIYSFSNCLKFDNWRCLFESVLFTSTLLCELSLVWQQDALPVGTDVFSGWSTENSHPSQVLSSPPLQRLVPDLVLALAPTHLQTGRGNWLIHKSGNIQNIYINWTAAYFRIIGGFWFRRLSYRHVFCLRCLLSIL